MTKSNPVNFETGSEVWQINGHKKTKKNLKVCYRNQRVQSSISEDAHWMSTLDNRLLAREYLHEERKLLSYTSPYEKKITVILKFREYVRFLHFFPVMLLHMSVIYIDNISHFGLSACF